MAWLTGWNYRKKINLSAGTISTWQANTVYSVGTVVKPSNPNGIYFICQTSGTSGSSEPSWNQTEGGTTTDNTVVWKTLKYRLLLKIGESSGSSDYNFHLEGHSSLFPSSTDNSGDIRITKDDGSTLLDIYVDQVIGTSPNRTAYIWFKLPRNPSLSQSIYIYYGNSSASNVSNWSNVILPYIDRYVGAAGWSARHSFGCVVFNNKIWVIGGTGSGNYFSDVWYSSDGVTWTRATSAAGWSARGYFGCVVFNNKIWVIGGTGSGNYFSDVWYSSDGVTWTQATSGAGWSARDSFGCVVFNNKIWVMGGYNGSSHFSDVWYSSDGVTWTRATSAAGWSGRNYFGCVVFNNKIWVMGGYSSSYLNDVYSCVTNYLSTEPSFLSAGSEELPLPPSSFFLLMNNPI